MNKAQALKRLDALDKEAKELRKIIEQPEEKSWKEIEEDYSNDLEPFGRWATGITKQRKRQTALLTIAYYLQGKILYKGWCLYYVLRDKSYHVGYEGSFPSDTAIYFKDEQTALKALGLYKQYLETE